MVLSYEPSQARRKKRMDVLIRFCVANKGEYVKKVLARFRILAGISEKKSLEYMKELKLAEIVVIEDNKIKDVKE